jgi:hypothetical protein
MRFEFTGRTAFFLLLVLGACYVAVLSVRYSQAREHIGQAREAIVFQLKAMDVRSDLHAADDPRGMTLARKRAAAKRLSGDTQLDFTSFECRGSLSGNIYFRVEYTLDGVAPADPVRYFSMNYSFLLGWRTSELHPYSFGFDYRLAPWVISRGTP